MKRTAILTSLLFMNLILIGQELKGVKSLSVFIDSIKVEKSFLDKSGNYIFTRQYNNSNSEPDNITVTLFNGTYKLFHEKGGGLSISFFELDSLNKTMQVYHANCISESDNFEYLMNIESLGGIKDLEHDTTLLSAIENCNKKLQSKEFYDTLMNAVYIIHFNENGDTMYTERNRYTEKNELCYSVKKSKDRIFEFVHQFDNRGNLIESLSIDNGDTTKQSKFTYDRRNKRKKSIVICEGKLAYIEEDHYRKGKLKCRDNFDPNNVKTYSLLFRFDKNDNMIEKKIVFLKDMITKTKHWVYEYY